MTVQMLKLADCVTLTKGKSPAEMPYFGDDAEPYLSPEYLRGKGIAEPAKRAANAVRVKDGDTILLWDGSNAGEFFRARDGLLASTMMLIRHGEEFEPEYFCYAAKRWEAYLKGQTSGSGIPHVDKEVLGKLAILKLPPDEQKLVAHILAQLDRAIEQTEALIAKQQRIKTGLMQDLLTFGLDEHGNIRSETTHAFKDSPLGRIPVEWDVLKFDEITPKDAPIGYGIVQPGAYDNQGVPVAGIYTINSDFVLWHMSSKKIEQAYARSRILGGDVLLSIKGTTGRVGVVPPSATGNISRDVARIRPLERINAHYLRYLMLSEFFQQYLDNAQVGTTRAEISIKILRQLNVLAPPRPEQNEIACRIAASEEYLFTTRRDLAKLQRTKAGLMHDLLTGKVPVTGLLEHAEAQS